MYIYIYSCVTNLELKKDKKRFKSSTCQSK